MGPLAILSVSSSEESETAFFLEGLLAASGAESSLEASSSTSFLLAAVDLKYFCHQKVGTAAWYYSRYYGRAKKAYSY